VVDALPKHAIGSAGYLQAGFKARSGTQCELEWPNESEPRQVPEPIRAHFRKGKLHRHTVREEYEEFKEFEEYKNGAQGPRRAEASECICSRGGGLELLSNQLAI
jgi:hypothetical protein